MFDDILYVEALANYVIIRTASARHITYSSLKNMEQKLPDDKFLKVQKSFIVALKKIDSIEGRDIHIADVKIPISRSHKDAIIKHIVSAGKHNRNR